jgi:hypothetical protein
MTPLPLTFSLNGWSYRQLYRVGRIALYSQGAGQAYEVFYIRSNKTKTFPNGKTVEAYESCPSASEWGIKGWTFHTKEAAEERMATLVSLEGPNARKSRVTRKRMALQHAA